MGAGLGIPCSYRILSKSDGIDKSVLRTQLMVIDSKKLGSAVQLDNRRDIKNYFF